MATSEHNTVKKIKVGEVEYALSLAQALNIIKSTGNISYDGSQALSIDLTSLENNIKNIENDLNSLEGNFDALENEVNLKMGVYLISIQNREEKYIAYSLSENKVISSLDIFSAIQNNALPYCMYGDISLSHPEEGGSGVLIPLIGLEINLDDYDNPILNCIFSITSSSGTATYTIDLMGDVAIEEKSLILGSAAYEESSAFDVAGSAAAAEANALAAIEKITPEDIGAAKVEHTHQYAGSDSNGGSANSAKKLVLNEDVGSGIQPVYFTSNGMPQACTYKLEKNVPSDAVFTDTTYSAAGDSLGLVKTGGDVTITNGEITVKDDSHNHTVDNVDGLKTTLNGTIKGLSVNGRTITYTKGDGTTGTIETQDTNTDTLVKNNLNTTAKAYVTGTTSETTSTGEQVFDTGVYLDTTAGQLVATTFKGVLDGNASSATFATSAGAADSAKKLVLNSADAAVGSETEPIYFVNGIPRACTYKLEQNVSSDAALTDTTYSAGNGLSLNPANQFSLNVAANSVLGGVKTTSSVNKTDGLIAAPIIEGVPYYKDTTYTQGSGITINGTLISNSGVRSIGTGTANGTISVDTNGTSVNVSVKGLGTAAYQSTDAFDVTGSAAAAEARANGYTDTEVGKAKTHAESCVAEAIGNLINGAPEALDTLNELAAALNDNPNFATTVATEIAEKLPLAGGTLTGNLIFNSNGANRNSPYANWTAVGGNSPYIGYAQDQSDGTFIICSMEKDTTTNGVKYYKNGLAIGGGSGNLFWKGVKVATIDDIPSIPTAIAVFG